MKNKQVVLQSRPSGMAEKNNFEIKEIDLPDLEEGQILIKNEYISVDPAIRGWMNEGTTYIPGIPIEGVIRAFACGQVLESKNEKFEAGDSVEGLLGVQNYATSDGNGIKKLDLNLGSLSQHLGILGMPGMTAFFGLLDKGKPQTGETVLISGAAGIVGAMVGQIAKIKGCKVIGIAGGKAKGDYLLELGFDAIVDYKNENINERLKQICPEGVHIFFDNVGGEVLDIALLNLARGARIVICGAISQYNDMANIAGPKNYMKILTARGYLTGIIVFDYLERYPEAVNDIAQWIKEGKIRYREHIIEGIENFPQALQMLFKGANFGKLLIKTTT